MVRQTFLKCLPCKETLNRWNYSKNYKPGICQEILEYVSSMVRSSDSKEKKLIFNVTFDEMHIKKLVFYCKNSHEWKGLVDLGEQLNEINKEGERHQASKALVFMLVNINGGFKTPVAYYLSNSLTGDEKCVLLKVLLIELHNNNINVVSVTFDGDESNQKACKVMGANFDCTDKVNFKPYFPHPSSSAIVYVFFDPCHILKLVPNYFALKGPIFDKYSNEIRWEYVVKLNNVQYDEGMHCSIKNRHVCFNNEKMNVFLAAQVLSSSTSYALHFLENSIQYHEFKGASYTAQFCKIINDIFDVLNSKNLFCKTPGRKAITEASLPKLKKQIDEWIEYLEQLEIRVPENKNIRKNTKETTTIIKISVLKLRLVKTGFVGLIICLRNLYALCESSFTNKLITYFLSYKISQDHVEMFFALIRRLNGFTSNPTTVQFQSAFKKLLLNNMNVVVPASANCTPQDVTLMVSDANEELFIDSPVIDNMDEKKEDKNNKLLP